MTILEAGTPKPITRSTTESWKLWNKQLFIYTVHVNTIKKSRNTTILKQLIFMEIVRE